MYSLTQSLLGSLGDYATSTTTAASGWVGTWFGGANAGQAIELIPVADAASTAATAAELGAEIVSDIPMGSVAGRLGRIARPIPAAPTGPSFPINELPAPQTGPLMSAGPGGMEDDFFEEVAEAEELEEVVDESVLEILADEFGVGAEAGAEVGSAAYEAGLLGREAWQAAEMGLDAAAGLSSVAEPVEMSIQMVELGVRGGGEMLMDAVQVAGNIAEDAAIGAAVASQTLGSVTAGATLGLSMAMTFAGQWLLDIAAE